MQDLRRRQLSAMRGIAQSLTYLRSEATAVALDEIAEAIGHAEQSVSDLCERPRAGA
jgi:hypothetical protein